MIEDRGVAAGQVVCPLEDGFRLLIVTSLVIHETERVENLDIIRTEIVGLLSERERLVEVLALRRVDVRDVVVGARIRGTQSDGALVPDDGVGRVALLLVGAASAK